MVLRCRAESDYFQPLTAIALPTMKSVPDLGGATLGGGANGVIT